MTRSIGAVTHGILDYLFAILLAAGPSVAGFAGRQARWCYILAAVMFAMGLLTQLRLLRLPVHGAIEMILALLLIIMPWMARFSTGVLSRNFYVAIGVLMILLWALTDFRGRRNAPAAGRGAAPARGEP